MTLARDAAAMTAMTVGLAALVGLALTGLMAAKGIEAAISRLERR